MIIYRILFFFLIISLNHAIVHANPNQTSNDTRPEPASVTAEIETLKTLTAKLEKQLSDLKETIAPSTKTNCDIDMQSVSELQPLMVSLTLTWPTYEISKTGKMTIPEGEEFFLICPKNFRNMSEKFVTATCVGGTKVMVHGVVREFSEIQCAEEVEYSTLSTSTKCLTGDSRIVEVLYPLFNDRTINVLEVCIDMSWAHGLYAKNVMQHSFGNDYYNTIFTDDDLDFSDSCQHTYGCCYSTRQLVSHKDLFPGVAQKAAFHYDYKICHDQNWNDVEHRVRSLLKSSSNNLLVWTGAKYGYKEEDVKYYSGGTLVPNYIWKVVQDPGKNSSLAIVQVNMPMFRYSPTRTLCPDVCNQTEWMKGSNWADINRGYTYCCSIEEFEKAFGFYNVFERNLESILIGPAPKKN